MLTFPPPPVASWTSDYNPTNVKDEWGFNLKEFSFTTLSILQLELAAKFNLSVFISSV